jgi:hypothetical protein
MAEDERGDIFRYSWIGRFRVPGLSGLSNEGFFHRIQALQVNIAAACRGEPSGYRQASFG